MENPIQTSSSRFGGTAKTFYSATGMPLTVNMQPKPKIEVPKQTVPSKRILQNAPKHILPGSPEWNIRMHLIGCLRHRNKVKPPIQKPKNEMTLLKVYKSMEKKLIHAALKQEPAKTAWLDNMIGILKKLGQIR